MVSSFEELCENRKKYKEGLVANEGFEEGQRKLLTELYPDKAHFIYELLQNAGADFDFINNKKQNYYAIIQNQEVIIDSNEPIEYKLNGKNITINNDKIVIDNEVFDNLGELEIIFMGNDFNWINEVPIDYSSRWFWKNGCNGWECEEKE